MAFHMRENVNSAVALGDNFVTGLPQHPLQTCEIHPPRVRDNQRRHANTVRKKRNELCLNP
ncbi:hypothetical protein MesoLj131a_53620 [Mesorhizobium sp. 131-2-1]|nr:hypothetical protein MesoLj131a_53620 [Mesorhizobium sp. 131-2-1]